MSQEETKEAAGREEGRLNATSSSPVQAASSEPPAPSV